MGSNTWNESPAGRRNKATKRRLRRVEYLAGKTCIRCGHRDQLTVSWLERPGPYPTSCIWGYGDEKRQTLLAQCRVVCFPCLCKERGEVQRVGHGEGARGIAGCDCDPCKERRSEYRRDRYLARQPYRPRGTLGQ